MKRSSAFGYTFSIAALFISGSILSASLTPAQAPKSAQSPSSDMIVILRDQLPSVPAGRGRPEARAAAISAAQDPILAQLRQMQAPKIHSFRMINAVATTLSKEQAAQLAADPRVQAVVPDAVIRAQHAGGAGPGFGAAAAASAANALCGTLEPEALQLTNTAFANSTTPQAQQLLDGNGQKISGKGVKVAFLADGLDPTVSGFIRPDGSHVFIDYQDFSGDPAGTPTAGGEAFGDASSIAAQDLPNGTPLLFDISQFVSPAHPLPSPCNISIRGMAPGASVVGLKVFSNLGYTTASSFVQAIEYAVGTDAVDVINESFGGNPYPDTANDPTSLANDAAVAAGVTVVVSSGDAGSAGTLGSPSTDPDVISVGATTQYRLYAQTGSGAIPLEKGAGYLDNNISPFSSGGFAQHSPRTVDVVAPGDSGWALCSTNTNLYNDCTNFASGATPIQDFGGTSESAPLTSGEAALVIQAYRSTHRGIDPTPDLVKRIIMSSATDLGAPSDEQGAGLINTLAAVNVALSVKDVQGNPTPRGNGVLGNPTSAGVVDSPGALELRTFTITNTGATIQTLLPAVQTLGPPIAGATLTLQLNPSTDPTFPNVTGAPRPYIEKTFTVPAGAQHLDAAIAFQSPLSGPPPIAYLALLDPSGRQASYSVPQGFGSGYGHVDVVNPAPGQWTVAIWTRPPGVTGSYSGPVQFSWSAERYVDLGLVLPPLLILPPGASAPVTAIFSMPLQAGDLAAAVRFGQLGGSSGIAQAEIPLSLRTLVAVGPFGGAFTGTLTGGNGRAGVGPTQTYDFDVPNGANSLSLSLEISDPGYLLEGLLVDPQGLQLSVQPNIDPSGTQVLGALQLFHDNPQPGRWQFILLQNFTSSGNQTSLPFKAQISFNSGLPASFSQLPDSPRVALSASAPPVTYPVQVRNTGVVAETYFADARLNTLASIPLATQPVCESSTLPGFCSLVYVPTQVSDVQFSAQSSVPITMDALNDVGYNVGGTGSPDIYAQPIAPDTVAASLSAPEVPYGAWIITPSLLGPYGPAGAARAPVITGAVALMKPFDPAISSDSGDAWADLTFGTNTYNPVLLSPGQVGTINVTITPDPAQVGKTVTGFVYIDTYNTTVGTGDEVVRIPYSYSVVP